MLPHPGGSARSTILILHYASQHLIPGSSSITLHSGSQVASNLVESVNIDVAVESAKISPRLRCQDVPKTLAYCMRSLCLELDTSFADLVIVRGACICLLFYICGRSSLPRRCYQRWNPLYCIDAFSVFFSMSTINVAQWVTESGHASVVVKSIPRNVVHQLVTC